MRSHPFIACLNPADIDSNSLSGPKAFHTREHKNLLVIVHVMHVINAHLEPICVENETEISLGKTKRQKHARAPPKQQPFGFYRASSYISAVLGVLIFVCLSVRLSVCHMRALRQNQTMHCGYFDNVRKGNHSGFLTLTVVGG